MASRSRSRDPQSPAAARSEYSRSPSRGRRSLSRSHSRDSRSLSPRRNGRYRDSRSWSRDRESRARSRSRSRSETPLRSTKIVVERLTKNVNEDHLREIFGQYGTIRDLDLPMNRQFNTNRGTAYILYVNETDAESAIAHMHEAQLDGAVINVSIVLPRRKFSPSPPVARRGANFDPTNPPPNFRGRGPPGPGFGGGMGGPRGRRSPLPPPGAGRYGPRSDTYRPRSVSRSRSRSPVASAARGRYRSRSASYSSRSRSPPFRARGGRVAARNDDDYDTRRRSPSRESYNSYRSRSRSRGRGYR